jgi:hypothetical protein
MRKITDASGYAERSQAWIVNWAICVGVDDPKLFSRAIHARMAQNLKDLKLNKLRETSYVVTQKVQTRVLGERFNKLEAMALAIGHTPVKLAGVMVDIVLSAQRSDLWFQTSFVGRAITDAIMGDYDEQLEMILNEPQSPEERLVIDED